MGREQIGKSLQGHLWEIQKGGMQHEQSQMAGMARPTEEPPPLPSSQGHAYAGTCLTSGANKEMVRFHRHPT